MRVYFNRMLCIGLRGSCYGIILNAPNSFKGKSDDSDRTVSLTN
jgi:hypothetical protein